MSDDKYQILKLVAKGGTAVLYRAIQTSLDRVVAVKKLHQHLTEDENFTRRFVLEAKAAASLDHDNIVQIIDFGSEDGSYFMVMEFIEGESLRDILDRCKQLPVDVALTVVYHVCRGLEHAHSKGIVHRDIKPGNIMLTRSGRIKVTDFGLAKLTQATTQHTADNSILGTPLYMSPEQAFGETVDHRSDLFSLGTVLYELVTGAQPFRDENYMGVIQNIIKKNAPHPSKFEVDTPPEVQSMLGKAMNKSREARFQRAADFRRAIEDYLGHQTLNHISEGLKQLLNEDGETVLLPKTLRRRKRKSRLRRGFTTALVAAILFGAAGAYYWYAPENVHAWIDTARVQLDDWKQGMAKPDRVMQADATPHNANPALVANDTTTTASPTLEELSQKLDSVLTKVAEQSITPEKSNPGLQPAPPQLTPEPEAEKPKPKPKPKATAGWLSIKCDPWAEIYVDGRYKGDAPSRRIKLERGVHTLECRNPKFETYREEIRIQTGELSVRNIVLQKLLGRISLSTIEGAEVLVNGVPVGTTPLSNPIEVDAGDHQITVKKAGYNVWNNRITVEADQTLQLNIMLSPMY